MKLCQRGHRLSLTGYAPFSQHNSPTTCLQALYRYNECSDWLANSTKRKSDLLLTFTIYHQGFFHSVRRNPSLNCLHRRRSLAILGHEGPRWWIRLSLHLVLGLPCRLFHSRGVHSVTLFVHLLSLNRAMCPAHPCIPFLITSMISFTPV